MLFVGEVVYIYFTEERSFDLYKQGSYMLIKAAIPIWLRKAMHSFLTMGIGNSLE
jgi:hypothetical protein